MATVQAPRVVGSGDASVGRWRSRILLVALVVMALAGTIVGLTSSHSPVSHEQADAREAPVYLFGRNLRGLSPLPEEQAVYLFGRNLRGLSPLPEPVYLFGRNLRGLSPLED